MVIYDEELYHTENEHAQSDKVDIVIRGLGHISDFSHTVENEGFKDGLFAEELTGVY